MFWGKKEHLKKKKFISISALTTEINRLPIHHESQQYLKMIEDVASDAWECIQFTDLASLKESQAEYATER